MSEISNVTVEYFPIKRADVAVKDPSGRVKVIATRFVVMDSMAVVNNVDIIPPPHRHVRECIVVCSGDAGRTVW